MATITSCKLKAVSWSPWNQDFSGVWMSGIKIKMCSLYCLVNCLPGTLATNAMSEIMIHGAFSDKLLWEGSITKYERICGRCYSLSRQWEGTPLGWPSTSGGPQPCPGPSEWWVRPEKGIVTRVGHAVADYAVSCGHAHIRLWFSTHVHIFSICT